LLAVAAAVPFSTQPAHAQQPVNPEQAPIESEFALEGGSSVGNIHVFAYADDRSIYPFGVEYDRHSWGGVVGARVDYVTELLPVVLLNEPAKYDQSSKALTTARQIEYGAGFSPIGVRLLWRRDKAIKPYLMGKGGILYFENRVLSSKATHLNFSAQFGGGVEARLTPRLELRLGYTDFHFSNGDIVARNPGIDFMYINTGVAYRFGK
jgi:opacity protein-like surface antigen